jgi:DNA-directed RNA polymerase specialized sigma24 family protein
MRTQVSPAEAKTIVDHFAGGRSISTLAFVYGVDVDTIEAIVRRAMHDAQKKRGPHATGRGDGTAHV